MKNKKMMRKTNKKVKNMTMEWPLVPIVVVLVQKDTNFMTAKIWNKKNLIKNMMACCKKSRQASGEEGSHPTICPGCCGSNGRLNAECLICAMAGIGMRHSIILVSLFADQNEGECSRRGHKASSH